MPDPAPAHTPSPIDFNEPFPSLAKPPIVEAMIVLAGRASGEWTQAPLGDALVAAMPDYPILQHLNASRFRLDLKANQGGASAPPQDLPLPGFIPAGLTPSASAENLGWAGVRLVSSDGKRVVTLTRDAFTLSFLSPYLGWDVLAREAMRLWLAYAKIVQIQGISSIHVRFINRLEVPEADLDPSRYFEGFGTPPRGMQRGPFLHQDTLVLTQFPKYFVSLVRTHDVQSNLTPGMVPLILDLEAICGEPLPADAGIIQARLAELHWVKNTAFFASVTQAYQDLCR